MTDRVVELSTTFLPLEQARQLLLPPVRLVRVGADALAGTVRQWELVLESKDGGPASAEAPVQHAARPSTDEGQDAPATPPPPDRESADVLTADQLPIEDWPELSYADAQARLAACDPEGLQALLAYERAHGHRPQYTLLLERRLASD